MSTTIADRHRRVNPEDLQERAPVHYLRREGTGDVAADIVPIFAERPRKTQRFFAFVAAVLIAVFLACVFTLFLAWIFARASVAVPFGLATGADVPTDTQSAAVEARDVKAPSFLSS